MALGLLFKLSLLLLLALSQIGDIDLRGDGVKSLCLLLERLHLFDALFLSGHHLVER